MNKSKNNKIQSYQEVVIRTAIVETAIVETDKTYKGLPIDVASMKLPETLPITYQGRVIGLASEFDCVGGLIVCNLKLVFGCEVKFDDVSSELSGLSLIEPV